MRAFTWPNANRSIQAHSPESLQLSVPEPIMTDPSSPMNRRDFLSKSAAVLATGAVLPRTALSYGTTIGANDRIALGHVGIGSRGEDLDLIASKLKPSHNVEMTAVCDL